MYRHLYPSCDEVRRVHVNVLLQFSRGHFIVVVFLAPLYALVVIRQNFAQFKKIHGRQIDDDITVQQGPTNAMHVFVRRATCVKHMSG